MLNKKKRYEIQKTLNTLNKNDLYSMLLFALYQLRQSNEYGTLSELSYVLDRNNLIKLLTFYGGTTIRIPTLNEMKLLTKALLLYEYVDIEGGDLKNGVNVIGKSEVKTEDLLETYKTISSVVSTYDFERKDA